jgi:hypothetical protein
MPMRFTANIAEQTCKFKKQTDGGSLLLPVVYSQQTPAKIPDPNARVNNGQYPQGSPEAIGPKANTYGPKVQ